MDITHYPLTCKEAWFATSVSASREMAMLYQKPYRHSFNCGIGTNMYLAKADEDGGQLQSSMRHLISISLKLYAKTLTDFLADTGREALKAAKSWGLYGDIARISINEKHLAVRRAESPVSAPVRNHVAVRYQVLCASSASALPGRFYLRAYAYGEEGCNIFVEMTDVIHGHGTEETKKASHFSFWSVSWQSSDSASMMARLYWLIPKAVSVMLRLRKATMALSWDCRKFKEKLLIAWCWRMHKAHNHSRQRHQRE